MTQAQTLLLSIGTSAGVAVQMLVLIVVGRRAGFRSGCVPTRAGSASAGSA
ncbi:hypothetical protein ACFQX6_02955 [Streptosporangium lutulentum]